MKKQFSLMFIVGLFLGIGLSGCKTGTSTTTNNPATPISGVTPTEHAFSARNSDGAETVLIPAGTYTMGATDTDIVARPDEKPAHLVTLSAFYIYKQEVTNEMYAKCVTAGDCPAVTDLRQDLTAYVTGADTANAPVIGVDWNMADAYFKWAGGACQPKPSGKLLPVELKPVSIRGVAPPLLAITPG